MKTFYVHTNKKFLLNFYSLINNRSLFFLSLLDEVTLFNYRSFHSSIRPIPNANYNTFSPPIRPIVMTNWEVESLNTLPVSFTTISPTVESGGVNTPNLEVRLTNEQSEEMKNNLVELRKLIEDFRAEDSGPSLPFLPPLPTLGGLVRSYGRPGRENPTVVELSGEAKYRKRERAEEISIKLKSADLEDSFKDATLLLNKNFDKNKDSHNIISYYYKGLFFKEKCSSVVDLSSTTEAVEKLILALRRSEKIRVTEECLKQIPISETFEKIIAAKGSSIYKEEITEEVISCIKNIDLPKSMGDITLNQVYQGLKDLSFKHLPLEKISVYPQLLSMAVSYGLVARTFNKLTDRVFKLEEISTHLQTEALLWSYGPFPSLQEGQVGEEIAKLIIIRSAVRVCLLVLFAPLMVTMVHIVSPSLFKLAFNLNGGETHNILAGDSGLSTERNNSIFGFIFSYFNRVNKWIKRIFLFIFFLLFYVNGGFIYISEGIKYIQVNHIFEIKLLSLLSLILPIIICLTALFLIMEFKINPNTIYKNKNKYPKFIIKTLNDFSLVAQKEELYNLYRKALINWTLLLVFVLIFDIILICFI